MAARLCTMSMKGTMNFVGGGGSTGTMRLVTTGGAGSPAMGVVAASVPSGW